MIEELGGQAISLDADITDLDAALGGVIAATTVFPVTIDRTATWDPALEEQVGFAIGWQTTARVASFSPSVCVNLLRRAAWGRAQECPGEYPEDLQYPQL